MKKKKKGRQVFLIVLLVIIVLIIGMAVGYLLHDTGKSSPSDKTQSTVIEDGDTQEDQTENMVIETEYGDLYYPEQWEEYLKTEQNMSDDSLQIFFSAHLRGKSFPMFQVTIGASEDAKVGEVTDDSGTKRSVYMKVSELEGLEELSEAEQHRIYAMQEDLNYVIDHLK